MGIGRGELLCMLAALMYTTAIIITDRASKKHDPFTLGVLYVGFMGAAGLAASLLTESSTHLPRTVDQWAYLLMLADRIGVDLDEAALAKYEKNKAKYPVEKAKGNSAKYDELD